MEQLRKQVRRAQWWLGVQRFVGALGWSLFGCLLVALGLVVADRFRPLRVEPWAWLAGFAVLGSLLAVGWSVLRSRGPLDAALEIDRRFGLKERVSSSLALSREERQSPWGQALTDDAVKRVARLDVAGQFRVRPGRTLLLPLLPVVVAVAVLLLVSRAVIEKPAEAGTGSAVKKQVETAKQSLRRRLAEKQKEARKQGLPEAEQFFEKLNRQVGDATKMSERKPALEKLKELSKELEDRKLTLNSPEQIRQQFKQMKDLSKGPADKFVDELTKGDFDKALAELKQIQNDLAGGKMTSDRQKKLADQLDAMQKNLQQAVDRQKQQRQNLRNQIQQAQAAGRNADADRLQQQLERLQQQGPPSPQLCQLAQQMGQCAQCMRQGPGSKLGLQNAAQALQAIQANLNNLKRQAGEAQMIDQAMNQIAGARQQMTCKNCGGKGCALCQGQNPGLGGGKGDPNGPPGMGLGEGRGFGARPEKRSDGLAFQDRQAAVKTDKGDLEVVGETYGPNLRGDVQRNIQQQVQAARHEEADPLTNQNVPRKQREQVGEYFDSFRKGEK